ncbi:MAG: diguanylate cyclase, partial [Pseudomonadota bacterium]
GRWGGEELVFLLADGEIGKNTFKKPLERIEKKLCRFEEFHNDSAQRYQASSSIGVLVITQEDAMRLTADQLFKVADDTLYKIKNSGRGRIEIVGTEGVWLPKPSNDNPAESQPSLDQGAEPS